MMGHVAAVARSGCASEAPGPQDDRRLFTKGSLAMGLGIVALVTGLVAAAAGLWVGFTTSGIPVALPGGLPAAEPEMVAIVMLLCGGVTMFVGALSIYRAEGY